MRVNYSANVHLINSETKERKLKQTTVSVEAQDNVSAQEIDAQQEAQNDVLQYLSSDWEVDNVTVQEV